MKLFIKYKKPLKMILKKEVLFQMIQEEVKRQNKKQLIGQRIEEIINEIESINNSSSLINEFESTAINNFPANNVSDKEEDTMSFYKSKPGQTLILNFEGLTLKLARQTDDVFKVINASQSQQLEDGDIIQVGLPQGHKGEHVWRKGSEYQFKFISRNIGKIYQTNKLKSWEVVSV